MKKEMDIISESRYYTVVDEAALRFYQTPKILFGNPKYKGLGLGPKLMYSILRDRQDLSIANNLKDEERWIDEDGHIYLLFSIEPAKGDERTTEEKLPRELSLVELLEVDRKTIMKYKKILVEYDLIIDKRMGQGKTSRTYVLKPEINDETVGKYVKSKKGTSRSPENVPQEVQKMDGNDTDISDTDISDTIILSPEENIEFVDNFDDDALSTKKTERKIHSNNESNKPNKSKNEFNTICDNLKIESFEDYPAILQALRLLYYSDKPLKINNMSIPPSQVREDLKMLKIEHIDNALDDYSKFSKVQEIRYPAAYLSRCIFNSIFQSELKVKGIMNYDFG